MRIIILLLIASVHACGVAGCGGGSSSSTDPSSLTVSITDARVTPKSTTINQNQSITFINSGALLHQVVSGTVTPSGDPLVNHIITITNTGFTPADTTANLGDTIRFSNASFNAFPIQIVDDNGKVISNITIPIGNMQTFTFPGAGVFVIRSQQNILFAGSVTLFGTPNPDGRFISPVLTNGGTFTVQFAQRGSFPYFVIDPNRPGQAFITGSVSVQ